MENVNMALPELCYSVAESTGELIIIERGKCGYFSCDLSTGDEKKNKELMDFNNEKLGVTEPQRRAMEIGSMFGWDSPGADPNRWVSILEAKS